MASETAVQIAKVRCSPFHSSLSVDPIGSAADYDAYLCVEVPLPWQRDISMSEPFCELCDAPAASIRGGDGRRWRPQGLVPAQHGTGDGAMGDAAADGRVEVVTWEQGGHHRATGRGAMGDAAATARGATGGPFVGRRWLVEPDRLTDLARAVLAGRHDDLATFADSRVDDPGPVFYICSHGQRDVCCGSMGTELFREVDEPGFVAGVGFRRCSHTGGHRFAATGITFPDGYAWAHLDEAVVRAISTRGVHPSELALHVRGSTLLPSGPAQVADRFGLMEVGWAWADAERSVELLGFERRTMATDLRVTAMFEDSAARCFEVRVGIERHVPQITCGAIAEPEYKVEPVWHVEASREVDPVEAEPPQ